jgi:hypothetical protein
MPEGTVSGSHRFDVYLQKVCGERSYPHKMRVKYVKTEVLVKTNGDYDRVLWGG